MTWIVTSDESGKPCIKHETELRDETNKSIWEEHHKTRMEKIEDENT